MSLGISFIRVSCNEDTVGGILDKNVRDSISPEATRTLFLDQDAGGKGWLARNARERKAKRLKIQ